MKYHVIMFPNVKAGRTSLARFTVMAARATQHSAQVLRAWQSALPTPPAHRRPVVSSLLWSLSSPSASLPYLKPTPWPTPAHSRVTKRGMATLPKTNTQVSEDESLARFHRAVRDESESKIDMWSLPLETLGVCVVSSPSHALLAHWNPEYRTLYVNEDVHIPSFPARVQNATLRDHFALLRDNVLNTLKNISRCAAFLPHSY